jgi:DNA-binding IclR family transcriptional regulator
VEPRVSDVGVLDKAMLLLCAVEAEPLALAGLVAATGIARPTAHRLAVALEVHGMLRRDEDGRFRLGPRAIALGRAASAAYPLRDAAAPALLALRDATGESAQLYVREGNRRICLASLESPHGLRTIVDTGASLPLDLGSAGAVLLGDVAVLKRGWAESVGQREAGVASVSAPVFDADQVIAAVSVSASSSASRSWPRPVRSNAHYAASERGG